MSEPITITALGAKRQQSTCHNAPIDAM